MKYFIILPLLCSVSLAFGQFRENNRFVEAGFLFGGTAYSGDVSASNVDLGEMHVGYGMFLRYHLNPKFSLKAHLYSGAISGDDKRSKSLAVRNFRFGTAIFEWATVAEWNFFGKERFTPTGVHVFSVSPYLYLGVGMSFINPEAVYYGPPDQRDKYLKVPFPEEGLKNRLPLFPMGPACGLMFTTA
ncbi:MAG: hypothetical protein IPL65_04960 [Lewinellaceae bacterium]|nr:hypothetical protein [Lewinellaceae bacterium]